MDTNDTILNINHLIRLHNLGLAQIAIIIRNTTKSNLIRNLTASRHQALNLRLASAARDLEAVVVFRPGAAIGVESAHVENNDLGQLVAVVNPIGRLGLRLERDRRDADFRRVAER